MNQTVVTNGIRWLASGIIAELRNRVGLMALVMSVSALCLSTVPARAQTPTTPVLVTTFSSGGTLGIPRWKGYMSPTNPNKFWASFANGGSSSNNLCYTTNAGATWSTNTITIDAYMDFHLSLFGRNDDLYFTFPEAEVSFRHFASPAESIADADPVVTFSGTNGNHRSNIMVQDNGRIWVFTRQGGIPSENVRYRYSDNGGANWTTGMAFSTGAPDVRIGSMPYVNGNPALVVLHLNEGRGYEYYLWNGSSFEARPDHSIYALNPIWDRCFTHNQINDTVMHLVFGQGSSLRHVWKNYNNGVGTWNTSIVSTEPNNGSCEWWPITTVQGDNLYLFYCRRSSSDNATMRVYYRKWSQASRTWSSEYQVSTQAYSGGPNTTFHVPASADYIPVYYSAGSGPYTIYFSKIVVTPQATDTIPPNRVDDLGALPGSSPGQVTLNWTATGDDDSEGRAASYDIRYHTSPLTEENWLSATTVENLPVPRPSGEAENLTISQLPGGSLLYFGVRAIDDQNNESELSNTALVLVLDFDDPDQDILLPDRTGLTTMYPNPFNAETRIEYDVAIASFLTIRVYNVLGQEVKSLVDLPRARGSYQVFWDGTDDRGSPVSSGIYFCRLVAETVSDTRKLVFLK